MTEAAIEQIWNYVNEVLDLHCGKFTIRQLCSRRWYLQTLGVLFPFLEEELNKISSQVQSEEAAIDRILLVLTQEGVIPEEYLSEVKGRNVVIADQESIMTLIQIVKELVEQALEEAEEAGEGEEGEEEEEEEKVEKHQEKYGKGQKHGYAHGQQGYAHGQSDEGEGGEEQLQDNEEDAPYNYKESNQPKEQQQPLIKNKMFVTNPKADSQPDRDRDTHSVQGIGNQFEADQQQQDSDRHHNQLPSRPYNPFPPSASSSKPLKATNYKNEEEDQQDHYLEQKLLKCKSEQQLKNLPIAKPKQKKGKKVRTLVAHPTIQKQYYKASTPAEKKLSKTVKTVIADSRKAFDKQNNGIQSPSAKDHLERKKRELNYIANAGRGAGGGQAGGRVTGEKSMGKLKKLLKWKEANLKRQQRQLQQQIEMKVQLKKQAYVKKINKLILNLEREKMLERKREERERRRKQKELAERRLQAIEQQYRDQMAMLQGRGSQAKKGVAHLDHRGIIEGLEKELKRENQKQINGLKTRLKRQEAQLDDDLQILQKEIVRAYKKC